MICIREEGRTLCFLIDIFAHQAEKQAKTTEHQTVQFQQPSSRESN